MTDERWQPVPVPLGDGRHDIGDDVRAAICQRLETEFMRDCDVAPEKARRLAMYAAASVRALLHEIGTLGDMAQIDASQSVSTQQVSGWQPIETALKDGSNILVFSRHRSSKVAQCVVFWREELGEWYSRDLQPYPLATHWMPLPEPPQ